MHTLINQCTHPLTHTHPLSSKGQFVLFLKKFRHTCNAISLSQHICSTTELQIALQRQLQIQFEIQIHLHIQLQSQIELQLQIPLVQFVLQSLGTSLLRHANVARFPSGFYTPHTHTIHLIHTPPTHRYTSHTQTSLTHTLLSHSHTLLPGVKNVSMQLVTRPSPCLPPFAMQGCEGCRPVK